jgi:MOSC domain-containing protein YiiM
LDRAALEAALAALPRAPQDIGRVDLLCARGPDGERQLPESAVLTPQGGMPGDRWAESQYGPGYQLATAQTDFARVVANGQALELHGDNLFLSLDLSPSNLPPGSLLRAGEALLRVTPIAHNGCKKWVQRFGLDAMQLNMALVPRGIRLRGIYLEVVESGRLSVGDPIRVVERAGTPQ